MDCVTHVTICIFHGNLCTAVNDNVTAALGINSSLPTTATCIQRTRASDRKRSVCHLNRVASTTNSIVLTDQGDGQIGGCLDTTCTCTCICDSYSVQSQHICIGLVCNGRNTAIIENIVHVRASNRCTLYGDIVVDRSECNFFCNSFIVPLKSYILRYLSVSTLIYCDSIASLRDASKSVLTITVRRRGSYHRRGSVCASCAQLDACTGNGGTATIRNCAGHGICCRGSSHVSYITTFFILPIDFQCPVYYRSRQLSAIVKLNQSCAGCIFCFTISATYFTFSISTITSIYFRVASCNYYFFTITIEVY